MLIVNPLHGYYRPAHLDHVERALLRSLPPGSGSGWPELQAAGCSREVADAALRRVIAEEGATLLAL